MRDDHRDEVSIGVNDEIFEEGAAAGDSCSLSAGSSTASKAAHERGAGPDPANAATLSDGGPGGASSDPAAGSSGGGGAAPSRDGSSGRNPPGAGGGAGSDNSSGGAGSGAGGADDGGGGGGGAYAPRPITQLFGKRKKIVIARDELLTYEAKCREVPEGFPLSLMQDIQVREVQKSKPVATATQPATAAPKTDESKSTKLAKAPSPAAAASKPAASSPSPNPATRATVRGATPAVSPPPARKSPGPPRPGQVVGNGARGVRGRTMPMRGKGLPRSANRWQPPNSRNESLLDKVKRKVLGILNKLAPEFFESLCKQLIEILKFCTTLPILQGIAETVFAKAVAEDAYTMLYARLCALLTARAPKFPVVLKLPNGSERKSVTGFKQILFRMCEVEVAGKSAELRKLQDAVARETDFEGRTMAKMRVRLRRRGAVRFVGALFVERLLPEKRVHSVVQHLLRDKTNPAEIDILCLEELLLISGRAMDTPKARRYMNIYFSRVAEMSKNEKLEKRLRFKCDDLLELRKNKWISARAKHNVQTLKGIRKDIAQEGRRGADRGRPPPRRAATRYGEEVQAKKRPTQQQATQQQSRPKPKPKTQPAAPSDKPVKALKKNKPKRSVSFNLDPEPKSPEAMDKKIDALVREYFSCADKNEAWLCVKDLGMPSAHWKVVSKTITLSFARKERERKLTVDLLVWLFEKKKAVTDKDFEKGMRSVLDELDDLVVDAPKAPVFLAAMCRVFAQQKCIAIDRVREASKSKAFLDAL